MMMAVSNQQRIEVLQEVLEKMDEIAHALRSLGDNRIEAYCLAAFEGKGCGWLGHFERDILEEALNEALHPEQADDEGDAD
jgi:hypothetical protein